MVKKIFSLLIIFLMIASFGSVSAKHDDFGTVDFNNLHLHYWDDSLSGVNYLYLHVKNANGVDLGTIHTRLYDGASNRIDPFDNTFEIEKRIFNNLNTTDNELYIQWGISYFTKIGKDVIYGDWIKISTNNDNYFEGTSTTKNGRTKKKGARFDVGLVRTEPRL